MVRLEVIISFFKVNMSVYFNSSMVRLEAILPSKFKNIDNYFNSSMVRLEVIAFFFRFFNPPFQFQYGAIRRKKDILITQPEGRISIPVWCD